MTKCAWPGVTCRFNFEFILLIEHHGCHQGKSIRVKIPTVLPGLFNPEYAYRLLSVSSQLCSSIVKDRSFLVRIPGYPSQTPDSQGGKPP